MNRSDQLLQDKSNNFKIILIVVWKRPMSEIICRIPAWYLWNINIIRRWGRDVWRYYLPTLSGRHGAVQVLSIDSHSMRGMSDNPKLHPFAISQLYRRWLVPRELCLWVRTASSPIKQKKLKKAYCAKHLINLRLNFANRCYHMYVHEPDYPVETTNYYFSEDEGDTYTSISNKVYLVLCIADKHYDGVKFHIDYHISGTSLWYF